MTPIGLDQLDQAALQAFIQQTVSEPATMPDPNVVTGLPDALKALQDASAAVVPTGGEISWPVAGSPAGFLAEDGSVQQRATYPGLFAVLGTTFNTGGEGPAEFRLPNNAGIVIKT